MAIARVQVKVGGAGKAADHDSYLAREDKYKSRLSKGETLEAVESGNMPAWAAADPRQFWRAADLNERKNGTTYREHELALPRELTPDQRKALVRDWVAQEIGDRHAYRFAIHRPKAADGQDQPHAHLMFSERQVDGIERGPDTYFKRYNAKAPEKGGARKGHGPSAGKTLTAAERAAELRDLRGRWADLVNSHLERAGRSERIDMRSYAERGIDRAPEPKQLPSAWRDPEQRGAVLEFRKANQERDQARAALRAAVPDPAAALDSAKRQRRAPVAAVGKSPPPAARGRLRDLSELQELEVGKAPDLPTVERPAAVKDHQEPQPPAAPAVETPAQLQGRPGRRNFGTPAPEVSPRPAETEAQRGERKALDVIDRGPPGTAERLYALSLADLQKRVQAEATAALEVARAERRQWDEARSAHDARKPGMIRRPGRLDEWKQAGAALEQAGRDLARRETAAERAAKPATIEAAATAKIAEQMPRFTARAAADRQARLDREAKEQQARVEAAKREKAAKDLERANARVGKDFGLMADKRRFKMFGYHDHSDDWKATPAALRDRIDAYNKLPERERAAEVERINRDPKAREQLKGLMAEREQAIQRQGRSR